MKRSFWISLSAVVAAMISFFGVTVYLFTTAIDRYDSTVEERIKAAAHYTVEIVRTPVENERDDYRSVEQKLASFAGSAGFEQIVVTDSLGLVLWSSGDVLVAGEDIHPVCIEPELFDQCIHNRQYAFTHTRSIGEVNFRSLYYPCYLADELAMVCIDADQGYFALARQFRNSISMATIVLVLILCTLLAILWVIDKKARCTAQRAEEQAHLAFLGQTSAELAHELKNPLAIIKSSIDVLRKKFDPEKKMQPFSFVSEEIMRLSRHINGILAFSKDNKLTMENVPFTAMVHDIVGTLQKRFAGFSLSTDIPDSLTLKTDRDALRQIIGNLLRNAAEAGDGKTMVQISTQTAGGNLRLHIQDNGPGIPSDIASRIFNPFVSGAKNSTGLGLAIVKRLCDACGWTIELSSFQAGNTRFTLTVPEDLWEKS